MDDAGIRAEFEANYRYANDYWSPFVKSANIYTMACAGKTWSEAEQKGLEQVGREPIEFNIIRRPIEFFSGYLRDNLNSVVVSPVEGSDEQTATQFTKLSYYTWDKGGGYSKFLDGCDEMFKSGISLCGVQMDYSKDFINGDITFYNRTYNSFYLDPTWSSLDLSDCSFAITRDIISVDYAKQLLKNVDSKQIDDIPFSFRDDKFLTYHPNFTNTSASKKLVAYDQYFRRTTRRREFLVDKRTDYFRDITDLPKEEREKLEYGIGRLDRLGGDIDELDGMESVSENIPQVEIRKEDRPYVELCVMLNGEPVYRGDDDTGIVDTFPFVPIVCYMEPSIWMPAKRIQGIASAEYSNQRQFNKRHMKIQDMFDSVISTGYKYLIGSVPDVTDLQQSGQNKLIGIDPSNAPEGMNSVQELQGGVVSQPLMEYAQILDQLSLTLANVNQSVLGIDEKGNTQVSGRLAQVRIAQGLRSNRKIFDNIETSQQLLGRLVVKCIQNKYSAGKIERILGEQPTQQFYEKEFEQYDCQIKEGVRSKSQKDAYYYELVSLKREEIVNVPESSIIKALEMAGIDELKKDIEESEKKAAEQQAKIDELDMMKMELANAQKEQMLALAQERRARVVADLGLAEERSSESEQNRADAALLRAKTITEIASMNEDRIMRVLEFVNMLEEQERQDRESVDRKVNDQADQINAETQGSTENMVQKAQVEAAQNSLLGSIQQEQTPNI